MTNPIILNVEDRAEDLLALQWALEDGGRFDGEDYDLIHAKDSDEALTLLKDRRPGFVIMDINLQASPIPNGLDLIPILKETNGFKVVVLTTSPAPEDVQKAIDNGALAVMEKLTGDLFQQVLGTFWAVFIEDSYCPRNLAMGPSAHFLWIHEDYVDPDPS